LTASRAGPLLEAGHLAGACGPLGEVGHASCGLLHPPSSDKEPGFLKMITKTFYSHLTGVSWEDTAGLVLKGQ